MARAAPPYSERDFQMLSQQHPQQYAQMGQRAGRAQPERLTAENLRRNRYMAQPMVDPGVCNAQHNAHIEQTQAFNQAWASYEGVAIGSREYTLPQEAGSRAAASLEGLNLYHQSRRPKQGGDPFQMWAALGGDEPSRVYRDVSMADMGASQGSLDPQRIGERAVHGSRASEMWQTNKVKYPSSLRLSDSEDSERSVPGPYR